jgi:hypothetical protein
VIADTFPNAKPRPFGRGFCLRVPRKRTGGGTRKQKSAATSELELCLTKPSSRITERSSAQRRRRNFLSSRKPARRGLSASYKRSRLCIALRASKATPSIIYHFRSITYGHVTKWPRHTEKWQPVTYPQDSGCRSRYPIPWYIELRPLGASNEKTSRSGNRGCCFP